MLAGEVSYIHMLRVFLETLASTGRCGFHIQTAMKHQFGEIADVLPLNDLHAMVRAVLYPWALIGHCPFSLGARFSGRLFL